MELLITKDTTQNGTRYFEAVCGKTTAEVIVSQSEVWVVCKNASHRVWGGMGKRFDTVAEAINGYKSSAMKAIISEATA